MNKQDRNTLILIIIVLLIWMMSKKKTQKQQIEIEQGTANVCDDAPWNTHFGTDPNDNTPITMANWWQDAAIVGGRPTNTNEHLFRYGKDSPIEYLMGDYLVGVDPELKGDFVPYYYCCKDDDRRVGLQWIADNDPESSPWNAGAVMSHGDSNPSWDTKTKKIMEGILYQCSNPSGIYSANGVDLTDICNKYALYQQNPDPTAHGLYSWGGYAGLTQCHNFPEFIDGVPLVLYQFYYGTENSTPWDYWGSSMGSRTAQQNPCHRVNILTGNQVGIRKIQAKFDYLKSDGSLGQYNKSWILQGCNTFCSNSNVKDRKWSGVATCETLGIGGRGGCTDPNYAEYDPQACYDRLLSCNSVCQTPIT